MYRLMLISTLAVLAQIPRRTYAGGQGISATDPMFESYTRLGCWKDEVNTTTGERALPSLEGESELNRTLDGYYTRRQDAVEKCFRAALQKNFEVFAVQDGGQCFSSADAGSKYKQFGFSDKCTSMKGGPMANDVYQISPLTKCLCLMPKLHSSLPQGEACFQTEQIRNGLNNQTALHVAAKFGETDCARILINSHAPIEAVDKAKKTPLQIAAGSKKCGVVKLLLTVDAKKDNFNKQELDNLKACNPEPETSAQITELPYEPVGCFKDSIPRALDSLEGSENEKVRLILVDYYTRRTDAITKCNNAATALGYKIFAVQDGGQCFSSSEAAVRYDKYGSSSDCGSDGKGGPMANAVYKIKTA